MNNKFMLLSLGALLYILPGCGAKDADHDDHDEHAEGSHTGEIHFTKAQAESAGLETEVAAETPFDFVIKTSGKIQSPQGSEQTVSATASGIVRFANASLTEGNAVGAGTTIAYISYKELPEGDPAVKAKIEMEAAEKEYKRAESLVADKIISQREFESIRSAYELAKATYQSLSASASGGSKSVATSMGGFVKQLLVRQGDFVNIGDPIAVISQTHKLQLRAEVPESGFSHLSAITDANFHTSYDDDTLYKMSELNGRVVSYGKSVEDGSPYVPIIFEFDNRGSIVGGTYAEVYLLGKGSRNAISLPIEAITEEQGVYYVYIQVDEDGYMKRQVELGDNNGERVEILSGVNAGERVVTKGAYNVKMAATSTEIPHGHQH
jgi:RND family efflux transporter MFP subunit